MSFLIEILRSTAELEALAPEWTALWESDPRVKPFQHPAWLIPWWHHFGQPDLCVVTLRDPGDRSLGGVIPLYVYREPVSGERQLLLLGAGTSDYLDAIVSPECQAEDLAAALRGVFEELTWDVAHIAQLGTKSPLVGAVELLHGMAVEPYAGQPTSRCAATPISGLPAKVRKEVIFCRNAAIAHGSLEIVAEAAETLCSAFDRLVATHTERWQRMGEPGVLADPAVLAWHREALPLLEEAGLLALLTLRLDGQPLATMYSLVDPAARAQRTQYLYLMGFDLRREELQPGRLLTAYTMDWAAREGITTIDMLRGEETYKRFWHVTPVSTRGFALRRRS